MELWIPLGSVGLLLLEVPEVGFDRNRNRSFFIGMLRGVLYKLQWLVEEEENPGFVMQ